MKRREFITLVSGITIWPLATQAQQSAKFWRLGYVSTGGLGDQLFEAFTQKLDALGYVAGKSIVVNRSIVPPVAKPIEIAITNCFLRSTFWLYGERSAEHLQSALTKAFPPCFCQSALPSILD